MASLPPPDPSTAYVACVQQLSDEVQADLNLRVQILLLQKEIQALQDELAKAQKK